jgi:thymidylate synthase (FAD)
MQDNKIDVLDHGFVRLIDSMGSDVSVSRAARVSYDAAWRAGKDKGSDEKLIPYLWQNHHTTPFESVTFTFEIKAPIFVFRQWHRHRTWSYNELSARYRKLSKDFYIPLPEHVTPQSKNNKQGRSKEGYSDAQKQDMIERIREHCQNAAALYDLLINERDDEEAPGYGLAKELSRMVLPVNTYSHMFGTVNLLNLLKFLTLRCDAHAQYEIRVYADAMRELIRPIVPVCLAAWEESVLEKAA